MNYWTVNMIPFGEDEKGDKGKVLEFQKKCIGCKIFGMGWPEEFYSDGKISDKAPDGCRYAYDRYHDMLSEGDIVVMRLKDAHYYIGRVKAHKDKRSPRFYWGERCGEDEYKEFSDDYPTPFPISWACEVEQWYEYKTVEEVPAYVVGRICSRPGRKTIERVSEGQVILQGMIQAMWRKKAQKGWKPNEKLSEDGFATSLSYEELEDLVASYIYAHEAGYKLLPSSCKLDQPKYEFFFVAPGKKPVTCQVKNQEDVPALANYEDDVDCYERIYLFSGKWKSDEAKALQSQIDKKHKGKIIAIEPSELFRFLTEREEAEYLRKKLEKFYVLH